MAIDRYGKVAVRFRGRRFTLDLADTFWKMSKGLMGRRSIPADGGMLFVFGDEGRHGFWMLNMKTSIDIIWLDRSRRVVHIWNGAKPCRSIFSCRPMTPERESLYVVELRAGTARKLDMKIGDRLSFSLPSQLGI